MASKKNSGPWNSTSGIYADFSKGFNKPRYYRRCRNCNDVFGDFKNQRAALVNRLCPPCERRDNEKLAKEVRSVAWPSESKAVVEALIGRAE